MSSQAGRYVWFKELHVAGQVAIAVVPAEAVEASACDAADVEVVLAGCEEVWLMYRGTCRRRAMLGVVVAAFAHSNEVT